jgi:hypothetical protein
MRPRPLVLGFAAAGPLGMAAVVLPSHAERSLAIALAAVLAAGFVGILRPWSYARSKWRAVGAAFWMFVPSALAGVAFVPADLLWLGRPPRTGLPPVELDLVWALIWVSSGFAGCSVAAIRAAWSDARGASSHPDRPPFWMRQNWTRSLTFAEKEVLLVSGSVATMAALIASLWVTGSAMTSSHREFVRVHVPPPEQFDALLSRDLAAHFGGDAASAPAHELLGGPFDGEYYVWVRTGASNSPDSSGLVRVYPVVKSRFEIREFVSARRIRRGAELLEDYPASIAAAALRRAGTRHD